LKSSISVLESSLKTTEGSSGHWETFGWLCAVAVGIGIAGEIVVIVSEHFEDLEDWERGIIRPPDRPPAWRFWFDIVATLIVLGGVFGEAGATGAVASINSQLRSKTSELRAKSDQLLAVTTEEAGDAATSAQQAKDASTAARSDAKTAHNEAEAAKEVARKAETGANEANGRALDAEAKLAEAEKKRAELEESIAPRDLIFSDIVGGPANGLSSREAIKPFDDFIATLYWIKDPEAERAAAWVYRALCGMGWTVEAMDGEICHKSTVPDVKSISPSPEWNPPGVRELPMRKMPLEGVQIFSYFPVDQSKPEEKRAERRSQAAARALKEYLIASGWTGIVDEVSPSGTMNPGTISIRVGFKPNPLLGKLTLDKAQKIMNQVLKEHNIPVEPPEVWH
jgi:hypothetical protein